MKAFILVVACGLFFFVTGSLAQDTTSSGKSKSANRTITGCLARGSGDNNIVLNGNDGSTWDVKSDTVALADHVGHTVKANGVVSNVTMHNMKEETKDTAASAGMKKTNDEHGDLKVSSIKMVSSSCK